MGRLTVARPITGWASPGGGGALADMIAHFGHGDVHVARSTVTRRCTSQHSVFAGRFVGCVARTGQHCMDHVPAKWNNNGQRGSPALTCVPVGAGGAVVGVGSSKDLRVQADFRSARLHRDGKEGARRGSVVMVDSATSGQGATESAPRVAPS
jgi:hypothetical protein